MYVYDIKKCKTNYAGVTPQPSRDLQYLHPYVIELWGKLVTLCLSDKIKIKNSCTIRSWKQQDLEYAKGRTVPGKKVTPCKGGQSMHNFGLAIDFYIDGVKGSIYPDHEVDIVISHAKAIGFTSGEDFDNIDRPHLQWTGGLSDKQIIAGKVPVYTLSKKAGAK